MTEQMAFTVPASKVLMPIEFVSSSSKRRDRMDKPEAVR